MNSKKTIPTIAGIFVLMLGVATGVFLLQRQHIFHLGASSDTEPKDVRITNITDTGFSVSWITDKETTGSIEWGESPSLGQTAHADRTQTDFIHMVTLKHLKANTKHYFQIVSGGSKYTQAGSPWQVSTGAELAPPEASKIISGKVQTSDGLPASGVAVYATVGSATPLATLTTQSGDWVISLANARNQSGSNYVNLSLDTSVELYIQGGPKGVGSAQTLLKNANPTQAITLGRSYDFRDETRDNTSDTPQAELALPEEQEERTSSFDLTGTEAEVSHEVITIDSLQNNEVIYTQKPEFFGSGPTGTEFTITIESDPVSDRITVNPDGWSWSPPESLEEGKHTLTISWTDTKGIMRKITRTFVVQAADGPSFESTPSDTTTTPSPTPKTSPSPSPRPSVPSSATPRTSITASDSAELPAPGSIEQTIILTTAGLAFLLTGIYVSIKKT